MYKRNFFVDHSESTSQKFTTIGTARVRLKQVSFRTEDGPDQRDIFIAKSSKPFLIVITTTVSRLNQWTAKATYSAFPGARQSFTGTGKHSIYLKVPCTLREAGSARIRLSSSDRE